LGVIIPSIIASILLLWWYSNSESAIVLVGAAWAIGIGTSGLAKVVSLGRRTDMRAQLEGSGPTLSSFSAGILSFAMSAVSLIHVLHNSPRLMVVADKDTWNNKDISN